MDNYKFLFSFDCCECIKYLFIFMLFKISNKNIKNYYLSFIVVIVMLSTMRSCYLRYLIVFNQKLVLIWLIFAKLIIRLYLQLSNYLEKIYV